MYYESLKKILIQSFGKKNVMLIFNKRKKMRIIKSDCDIHLITSFS